MKQSTRMRDQQLSIRVEPDLREAIEAAADRDQRPVSNLVRVILSDWLRAHAADHAAQVG
jgi:uncharacterized protein (DUF1778 family)